MPVITIPVHIFIKSDLYANPEAIDFGAIQMDQLRNPATAGLLTQTFLLRKRTGKFGSTRISTNLDLVQVTRTPEHGNASTHRIDLALNPRSVKRGSFEGMVAIKTPDKKYSEIRVLVKGNDSRRLNLPGSDCANG